MVAQDDPEERRKRAERAREAEAARWRGASVVGSGETASGPWVLEALCEEDGWRRVRVRHPDRDMGGTRGWAKGGGALLPNPGTVGFHDGGNRPRPSLLVGHAAYAVRRLEYETLAGDILQAQLFPVPGDDEYRAFIVPSDDPGDGKLRAYGADGLVLTEYPLSLDVMKGRRELEALPVRSGGEAGERFWTFKAGIDAEGLLAMYFELSEARGPDLRPRRSGHGTAGPTLSHWQERFRVNMGAGEKGKSLYCCGQAAKTLRKLRVVFDDGTTELLDVVRAPDLAVDLFVAVAPSGRLIADIEEP